MKEAAKVTSIAGGRRIDNPTKAQLSALEKFKKEKISRRHVLFCEVLARLEGRDLAEVAELAGVHYNTLWWWLNGDTSSPLFNNLVKVANVLGYELELVDNVPTKRTVNKRVNH